MPELPLEFARTFVEFPDPDSPGDTYRCDLTWLTSRWTCIFGQGCPGIYDTSPDAGCCTLGAHFSGDEDVARVAGFVAELDASTWERHADGIEHGWTETDEDGELKTRAVDGACIFHNSKGFAGGYGCALHSLALKTGRDPVETKPDVCWQLPLRRTFREVDPGDGNVYTETSIGEYTRAGWGAGGHDLDWYCTSNTEAHIGSRPVYVANRSELVAMMGETAYATLVEHCEAFIAAGRPVPHPADTI